MGFYQLSLIGRTQAQQMVNVFHYVTTSLLASNAEANALNIAFQNSVMGGIKGVVSQLYNIDAIYTIAPQAPDVFSAIGYAPGTQTGGRPGDPLPTFVAWSFECVRTRRDIRNGYKRFGPISESDQSAAGPSAGVQPSINALAAALGNVFSLDFEGSSSAATPVIVKRIKYVPNPENPERYAYRIPGPGDPLEYYDATKWVYEKITSQNTRKIGRGA